MSKRYLTFAVFSSGLATLGIELSASRLLGAVFGTSNLVWASIIALILIYLTAGYFIGGRWADRSPYPETFYRILLWASFSAGIVPLVARPVLRTAADAFDQLLIGILAGAFVSVLVLFVVPIILLGTASPFAIRLSIEDTEHAGQVSGRIYAISTLGSFIGTFLPELVFIPWVGTTGTFLIFSGYLMLVALIGLAQVQGWRRAARWLWMPIVLALLAALWWQGGIKSTTGQIYETESQYNYIQVLEIDGVRYLRLNEGQGVHSAYAPEQLAFAGPWMQFLTGPFFNPDHDPDDVQSMAIIGLAAGTSARQATAVFGDLPIDGYELDPRLIEIGRDYFDMTQPNLNAIALDGRWGLAHSEQTYSLIEIDAYRPPYIPWHLTTVEFFSEARAHLTSDGVLAINVGRAPEDRRLIDTLVATLQEVFASVHVMDVPNTFNSLVYATVQPTSFADLQANFDRLLAEPDTHPLLLASMQITLGNQQPTPSGGQVLTDERAPIEWIVNSMVLRFVLGGDYEELQ